MLLRLVLLVLALFGTSVRAGDSYLTAPFNPAVFQFSCVVNLAGIGFHAGPAERAKSAPVAPVSDTAVLMVPDSGTGTVPLPAPAVIPPEREAAMVVAIGEFEREVGPIVKRLGSGGEAVVVEAADPVTQKNYAYRLQHNGRGNPEMEGKQLEEWYRDYPAWAKANGIPEKGNPMLDASYVEKGHAVRMEIAQASLVDVLGEYGPKNISGSVEAVLQMSNAVAYVNSKDVLHHDIKPANFIRRHDGTIVITDFGVAGPVSEAPREDGSYRIRGTLPYISRQALSGGKPGLAVDAFALRISAMEVILGRSMSIDQKMGRGRYTHDVWVGGHTIPVFRASPHTLNSRVPAAISAAIFHPSHSAREFGELMREAAKYQGPGQENAFFEEVYGPRYFMPLFNHDPAVAVEAVRTSRELFLAWKGGHLKLSKAAEKRMSQDLGTAPIPN